MEILQKFLDNLFINFGRCQKCGKKYEADEAEIHESGECLHIVATENYIHEAGENYIFSDKDRTRQFCMEFILNSGYPENIGAETRDKIIALIKSRIEFLKVIDEELISIPPSICDSLWAALDEFEYLNSYDEYKSQVREFCLDDEGIDEYAKWYCTARRTELYGEWIDTNEVKTAV